MERPCALWGLLIAALLSGCTARHAYGTAQGWQRNQCNTLPDKADYERCMSNAGTSYDEYRKRKEGGQQ